LDLEARIKLIRQNGKKLSSTEQQGFFEKAWPLIRDYTYFPPGGQKNGMSTPRVDWPMLATHYQQNGPVSEAIGFFSKMETAKGYTWKVNGQEYKLYVIQRLLMRASLILL